MKPIVDEILLKLKSDKIILKGGYLLKNLYGDKARYTTDINLTLLDVDIWDKLVNTVKEVLDDTGILYEIKETHIKDSKFSTGRLTVYKLQPDNKKEYRLIWFGLDASYHNISSNSIRTVDFTSIKAYSNELILADKIKAILSRACFRCIKDFYDINLIISLDEINLSLLTSLFRNRGGYDEPWFIPFKPDNFLQLERAWNVFIEDAEDEIDMGYINFRDTMKRIFGFIYPELAAENKDMTWNPERMKWIKTKE